MRLFGPLILAGVLAGLTGCRSEKQQDSPQGEPSALSPPAARPTSDSRPTLICFGNSLTAGFGADPGASYPDFLQKDLDASGYPYRVVNEGVSGNTTKDGVERLPGILALHPALVVLEFGGNDGLRGLKVQTTRDNLAQIIVALKQANIKVLLAGITLPPDYGPDYVRTFTATYTSLGKQFSIPVLPFLLQDVYGVPGLMQADNTHATARGNEVVARNVLRYLQPLLRKQAGAEQSSGIRQQ